MMKQHFSILIKFYTHIFFTMNTSITLPFSIKGSSASDFLLRTNVRMCLCWNKTPGHHEVADSLSVLLKFMYIWWWQIHFTKIYGFAHQWGIWKCKRLGIKHCLQTKEKLLYLQQFTTKDGQHPLVGHPAILCSAGMQSRARVVNCWEDTKHRVYCRIII